MSIQQRIASDVYRMAEKAVTPDQIKSIQAHLVRGVQTGTVPSYVGVPLLNDLNQKMARIQTAPAQAQAMVQQPPIAQQVMGQAEQGVETLPSGLPEEGMAGGGIVAFADGGMSDYEMAAQLLNDEDDEDEDYVNAVLGDLQAQSARYAQDEDEDGLMATRARESMMFKQGDKPAQGVQRERTSVTGRAGLEDLLKMIEQKESGGRGDYDKYGNLLTSSAGAQGRMQVMPGTSRDPGFGIRPAKEGDVEDLARVGREYYTKMLERYDDPKLAAIAYNWGPGNTDSWLKSGADMSKLPKETRNYVANMAEGGAVRFADKGLVDISSMTPEEIKDAMRRRIKMEGAREAFTKVPEAPKAPPSAAATSSGLGGLGAGFLGALGLGGAGLTLGAGNQMRNLSEEQREQLSSDIGSDTGFAAAIMNAAKPSEPSKPSTPAAGVATLPSAGAGRGKVGGPNLEESKRAAFEREVGATQDAEDMDAGLYALPTPESKDTQEAAPKEGGIRQLLDKYRSDIGKQREIDNYMSLLSAGLGMMGGTSPYASANIGQGALQGVRTYQQAAQQRSADERGLLSAELGLKKYEQLGDIRRAAIAAQQAKAVEDQDIKRARLAQNEQKVLVDRMENMRKLAQTQMLAAYKGALTEEEKSRVSAEADMKLLQDPEYAKLYEMVNGFKPKISGGYKMSADRAKLFSVER